MRCNISYFGKDLMSWEILFVKLVTRPQRKLLINDKVSGCREVQRWLLGMILFNNFIINLEEGVNHSLCSRKFHVILHQDVVGRGKLKEREKIEQKQESTENSNIFRSFLVYLLSQCVG
jgi:hypothetical protein